MDPTLLTQMLLSASLWLSPAAPAPMPVWETLTGDEAVALRELDDGSLDEQRGGALEETAPFTVAERAALAGAQEEAPELDDQRGGDLHLTDREIEIILWTAAAVVLLIIIL